MSLESLFKDAVHQLEIQKIPFAVAGGLAASLYRQEPRMTMDVDLVIMAESGGTAAAVSVLQAIGLETGIALKADLAGGAMFAIRRKNTATCMVVGRAADQSHEWGVDILLPALPWAGDAVLRAQDNQIEFGFGAVPTLTLEDMILAKLHALSAGIPRPKDLDDLQSIYTTNGEDVDTVYLAAQMRRFALVVPASAKPFLPAGLLTLARDIQRQIRRNS